jgi:rsbT co-antagonist protein RsbR
MVLAQRLAALESSGVPTWVFDPELFKLHWANDEALAFWRAESRGELLARDFSDMTASTRTRIQGYLAGFRRGLSAKEQWTLYPRGKPATVVVYFSGIELDDGRTGALVQAFPTEGHDPELVRGIEALRHTSILVTLIDEHGAVLMRNPAVLRAFGGDADFGGFFVDAGVAPEILSAALEGRVIEREVALRTVEGERWYALEARPMRDVVTGQRAVLVHLADQTARRAAEHANKAKSLVIEEQRLQILSLSAPILDVAPGTLAVPLIGSLDPGRAAELSGRLLSAIATQGAERIVLDLTGLETIDSASAEHLLRMLRAVRLLGASPVVTGLSPALATTLTGLGIELAGVLTRRTLRDALTQ